MESSIRRFLPVLGHLSLTGIGVLQVQNLVTTMKGRKRRTCLNGVVDLLSILRVARGWNYQVPVIKLESLRPPLTTGMTSNPFSRQEKCNQFWRTLKDVDLLACTGLRASEILGLRVCDMDFGRRQIHIRQSCW